MHALGVAQGIALFLLGGLIATALPRPLQEDKRVWTRRDSSKGLAKKATPKRQAAARRLAVLVGSRLGEGPWRRASRS